MTADSAVASVRHDWTVAEIRAILDLDLKLLADAGLVPLEPAG